MPPRPRPCPATRARLLAVLALAVLTGCGGTDPGTPGAAGPSTSVPGRPSPSTATGPTTPGPSAAEGTGVAPGPVPGFGAPSSVAVDIQVPWGVAFLPDGDALVAERPTGRIFQVGRAGDERREVLTLPGVADRGEGGLLGLAVSPTYATDGLVYAYYTTEEDNRIVRFTLDGEPEVLLEGLAANDIHNGGRIAFGPDGMLYAGSGTPGTPTTPRTRTA